jgi:hypothetical protein
MKQIRVLVVYVNILLLSSCSKIIRNEVTVKQDAFIQISCEPYFYPSPIIWPKFIKGEIINRKDFWEISHSAWAKLINIQHETARYLEDIRTSQIRVEKCIEDYNQVQKDRELKQKETKTQPKVKKNFFQRLFNKS